MRILIDSFIVGTIIVQLSYFATFSFANTLPAYNDEDYPHSSPDLLVDVVLDDFFQRAEKRTVSQGVLLELSEPPVPDERKKKRNLIQSAGSTGGIRGGTTNGNRKLQFNLQEEDEEEEEEEALIPLSVEEAPAPRSEPSYAYETHEILRTDLSDDKEGALKALKDDEKVKKVKAVVKNKTKINMKESYEKKIATLTKKLKDGGKRLSRAENEKLQAELDRLSQDLNEMIVGKKIKKLAIIVKCKKCKQKASHKVKFSKPGKEMSLSDDDEFCADDEDSDQDIEISEIYNEETGEPIGSLSEVSDDVELSVVINPQLW